VPGTTAQELEDAAAFMKRVADKMASHQTVQGTLTIKQTTETHDVLFKAMRPNYFVLTNPEFEAHGTGAETFMFIASQKGYMKMPKGAKGFQPHQILVGLGSILSDAPQAFEPVGKAKPAYFQGKKVTSVQLKNGIAGETVMFYVLPDTLEPVAFASLDGKNSGIYKDVKFDEAMKAEDFAWMPPADAKDMGTPPSAK
jgi:hypothetical protein